MAVLVIRVMQTFLALLILAMMILIRTPTASAIVWCMRIAPGVAMLHTLYGIYHLARKASGRTPASSASYMLFAVLFDATVIAFYILGGYTAYWQWDPQNCGIWDRPTSMEGSDCGKHRESEWATWQKVADSNDGHIVPIFLAVTTIGFCVTGLFHLITLSLSLWLFAMFRKVMQLPPDMNPLEDNLTSRNSVYRKHEASRSSISTMATTYVDDNKSTRYSHSTHRGSVARAYDDAPQLPSIPFMHTRNNSSSTLTSYTHIPTTNSAGDLPARNYAIPFGSANNSPRNSQVDLKRASVHSLAGSSSPPKRGSYAQVPALDENWFQAKQSRDSALNGGGPSPLAPPIQLRPGYGRYEDVGDGSDSDVGSTRSNPLGAHPVNSPKQAPSPQRIAEPRRESALSQMTLNRMNTTATHSSSIYSTDTNGNPESDLGTGSVGQLDEDRYAKFEGERRLTPSPRKQGRGYNALREGAPPLLVGGGRREVSSGADLGTMANRREVSGKVAEEGRGGEQSGWGARFRKVSGLGN